MIPKKFNNGSDNINLENRNLMKKRNFTCRNKNYQNRKLQYSKLAKMESERQINLYEQNYEEDQQEEREKQQKEIIPDIEQKKEKNDMKRQKRKSTRVSFKINENLKVEKFLNTQENFPIIPKSKLYITIDNIFSDQELNDMNFLQFLKYDKRTLFQTYFSFLNHQSPLFFLLHYYNSSPNENYTFQIKYPSLKLIFFCIQIYVCFFFNATVFGTKSAGYQFYGTYTFWKHLAFGVVLCPFCLIVNSLFHFLLFFNMTKKIIEIKIWCYTKLVISKSEKDTYNFDFFIKKEYVNKYYRKITKLVDIKPNDFDRRVKHEKGELKKIIMNFLQMYKKKIIYIILFTSFGILFMWYFVTAFCVAFKNSQGNFLLNILITFILCNLFPGGYCFLPAYLRRKAFKERNKKIFIISHLLRIL